MRQYNRSYLDESGTVVKLCGRCDRTFPYTTEYFASRGKYGMSAYCIKCTLEVAKMSKKKNRTRKGEYVPRKSPIILERGDMEYKICTRCEQEFPNTIEFFDSVLRGNKKLRSVCKKCRLDDNHRDSEKFWARTLHNHARNTSARRGLEFSLTVKDITDMYSEQDGKCFWTGVRLVPSRIVKYPLQPSLDRLDCSCGYTRDNVVLCCFIANMGRNNTSVDEFKKFLQILKEELEFSQWEN